MNVRELMEALGAGDLDAEVYVALPGEALAAPLSGLDDVDFDLGPDDDPDETPVGLVLWPAASRRRIRVPRDSCPLVGPTTGHSDARANLPPPPPNKDRTVAGFPGCA